jgi:hypothetical protein
VTGVGSAWHAEWILPIARSLETKPEELGPRSPIRTSNGSQRARLAIRAPVVARSMRRTDLFAPSGAKSVRVRLTQTTRCCGKYVPLPTHLRCIHVATRTAHSTPSRNLSPTPDGTAGSLASRARSNRTAPHLLRQRSPERASGSIRHLTHRPRASKATPLHDAFAASPDWCMSLPCRKTQRRSRDDAKRHEAHRGFSSSFKPRPSARGGRYSPLRPLVARARNNAQPVIGTAQPEHATVTCDGGA